MFVDSSYWVALVDVRDQWHDRAVELKPEIRGRVSVLDLALSETLTIVGARRGGKAARELYGFFLDSCTLHYLESDLLDDAMALHLQHHGRLSVADCATIESMARNGDSLIVSFDRDFDSVMGLTRVH